MCVEETLVQPEIQHRIVGLIQHGGHHAAHVLSWNPSIGGVAEAEILIEVEVAAVLSTS